MARRLMDRADTSISRFAQIDAWIRNNHEAKGWDRIQGRPLLIKSDLVGHGGRMLRCIEAHTQLSLWAEFLGSHDVHAGALLASRLALVPCLA